MSASPVLFVCEDLQVVICFIPTVQEEMGRGKMACYARKMEQSLSGTHWMPCFRCAYPQGHSWRCL